jgi:hypothetical protein
MDLDAGTQGPCDPAVMLWGDGFEVETLINVRIAKAGVRVVEVPSFERTRQFGTSKLHAFSDGLRVLRTIHSERSRSDRTDAPPVVGIVVGVIRSVNSAQGQLVTPVGESN